MNMEAEIRELRRRVGELEGGWGFITTPIRDVHRALLEFQEETDVRFDKTEARFDKIDARLDRVESGLRSLREDLPSIVGSAVREVMNERGDR